MKVVVPKEIHTDENRVALVPDVAGKLDKAGLKVYVESGAGDKSYYTDQAFRDAGATVVGSLKQLYDGADVVLKVHAPGRLPGGKNEINLIPSGAVLICFLEALRNPELAEKLAKRKITSFSMDTIPRISRAQSMDALSSQASTAGYKAVLLAASALQKFFPMLITAAGTIAPAKVFVIGAGVAGLQAVATARRLGADVEAFDIRPVAKGEVESLGARFVEARLEEETETTGGYAKEVSEEGQKLINRTVHEHVKAADVVITTAQVPGKKAPLIVTTAMVEEMRTGSVVVDLAAEQGGNCQLTKTRETYVHKGVTIMGPANLPGELATHASQMYARNISTLLLHFIKEGRLDLDFNDKITAGCCITHNGQIVNEDVLKMKGN